MALNPSLRCILNHWAFALLVVSSSFYCLPAQAKSPAACNNGFDLNQANEVKGWGNTIVGYSIKPLFGKTRYYNTAYQLIDESELNRLATEIRFGIEFVREIEREFGSQAWAAMNQPVEKQYYPYSP